MKKANTYVLKKWADSKQYFYIFFFSTKIAT